MVDAHGDVVVLVMGGAVEPGQGDVCAWFVEGHIDRVSGDVGTDHDRGGFVAGSGGLAYLGVSDVGRAGCFGLNSRVAEECPGAEADGGAGVGQH